MPFFFGDSGWTWWKFWIQAWPSAFQKLAGMDFMPTSARSVQFVNEAATTAGGSTTEELFNILKSHGFKPLQHATSSKQFPLAPSFKWEATETGLEVFVQPWVKWGWNLQSGWLFDIQKILGLSVEHKLKPTVRWLSSLGLSAHQIVGSATSQILDYSLEQNLKPTLQWLLDLGLTKSQAAKAVATSPRFLGLSIEKNLKPTVQFLLDLGLTKSQVVKAVATSPRLLGLSIEQNLTPTVQWLLDCGLTMSQVAKAVASSPQLLGLSIEQELEAYLAMVIGLGPDKESSCKGSGHFSLLSESQHWKELKAYRAIFDWDLGLTKSRVVKAVAAFPQILSYSIEQNLKPTVQSLLDLELTKSQVAKAVADSPQLLGLSIEQNLKPTVQWLLDCGLTMSQVAKAVASSPQLFGLSIEQKLEAYSAVAIVLWADNESSLQRQWPNFPAFLGPQRWPELEAYRAIFIAFGTDKRVKLRRQWPLSLKPLATALKRTWSLPCNFYWNLGLTNSQVVKAVANFSSIVGSQHWAETWSLRCSGYWNCGLTMSQVAKASGQVASNSWLQHQEELVHPLFAGCKNLGWENAKLASLISSWPRILGYSISKNPWAKGPFFGSHVYKKGRKGNHFEQPRKYFDFSHQRMAARLNVLSKLGETRKACYAMTLPDKAFQKRFTSWVASCKVNGKNGQLGLLEIVLDHCVYSVVRAKSCCRHVSLCYSWVNVWRVCVGPKRIEIWNHL